MSMWLALTFLALGQTPCTDVQAEQTIGKWVVEGKLSARNEKIVAALKSALPEPRGFDVKITPNARGLSAYFLAYYCVPNKGFAENIRGTVRRGDETGTTIYFTFGSIDWLANERMQAGGLKLASGEPILYLAKRTGERQGRAIYTPDIHRGRRGEEALVLGVDSPYRPLTRAELAQAKIDRVQKDLAAREAAHQKLDRQNPRFKDWQTQYEAAVAKLNSELAALNSELEDRTPASENGRPVGVAVRGAPLLAIYSTWDLDAPLKSSAIQDLKEKLDLEKLFTPSNPPPK